MKWQVNKIENGWEIRHENGKQATQVIFTTREKAQNQADYYNKTNLGFCPLCGISQIKSWICPVCANKMLETNPLVLNGRKAYCPYHQYNPKCVDSSLAIKEKAFFEYRPNHEFDSFYCGCKGWD